jgi:hypothetical protein
VREGGWEGGTLCSVEEEEEFFYASQGDSKVKRKYLVGDLPRSKIFLGAGKIFKWTFVDNYKLLSVIGDD